LIPQGVGISDTTNYCSIQITTTGDTSCKIPLDFSWVFDAHSNPLNALALMDEQDDFDPICQTNALPNTLWGANFNDPGMEQASIDLQDYYYIDAITIADVSAIGELTIQIADSPNGPWTTIEEYQTIELNKWVTFTNSIPADKPIRYLRLIASDDDRAVIGELFLCGRLSNFTANIPPGMAQNVQVEGINCFSADLTWDHPFDEDISHYKVVFGNETQLFPYTAANPEVTISNLEPETTYDFHIITVDSIGQESDTLTITTNTLPEGSCELGCNPNCPCQICLNPSWISAETPGNTIPASYLVDEQSTVAICGQVGTTPTTGWGHDFGSVLPVAILDLQQIYLIESFRFFDSNGIDNFKVEYKDDQGNWIELFDYITASFNSWVLVDNLNVATRFLRISELNNGARVNEIAICGYPICTEIVTTELFDTLCQGASVVFNDQTLTTTGTYFDTLQTAVNACDSFVVLNLSVFDTVHTAVTAYICDGETYAFNGQNLSAAGVYLDTLATANACDSFVTLTLNVFDTAHTEITSSICQGDSYPFNGQNLTTAGVYLDTLATSNACDSFITLTLTVFNTANTSIDASICQGETYPFNGQNLTTAGVYLDTLATTNACDSFITLTLSVLQEGDSCDDGNSNTTNDELDENCNCVGESVDPTTCQATVTLSGDTIMVNNLIQPITQVDIFNENYSQTVYTCGLENCNTTEIITGLPVGIYHVKIQSWTAGFAQMVCNVIVDIEIGLMPPAAVCEVSIAVNEDIVEISNLNQPITQVDIFNENYSQTVYTCGLENCNTSEMITGLANGIYHVKIQSWTAGFAQRVCDTIIDIEIGMMPPSVCDVKIITGTNFLSVDNLDEPLVSMFIFTGDYSTTLFQCDYGDCPPFVNLTNLQPGAYVVKVQSYTANFNEEICNFLQTVIVDESNNICLDDSQTHFFGVIKTGMYQAENAILSRGLVNQDTVVTFTATNDITLSSGFHASAGSSFTAMIDNCSDNTFVEPVATSRTTETTNLPLTDKFLKVAPNPFRNSTTIQYQLPNKTQEVSLFVYDMTGQIIQRPIQGAEQTKGFYSFDFHGDHLLAGMYYVALQIDGAVLIEKIAVVR